MKEYINKILFIGMGLINSSLARDLKQLGYYKKSHAISRKEETIKKIRELKLVDVADKNYKNGVENADLIIIGIPVAAYESVIKKIIPFVKQDTIITDVGSVKFDVIKSVKKLLPKNISFIPGHPIAGTENSGPESGFQGLFKGGWCILTPDKRQKKNAINTVKNMWLKVGMKVDIMDPRYHDNVLAITSHIPHIIAYSIVGTVTNLELSLKKEVIKYAASGFRDFTRIAASDPIMWRDIMISNKNSIINMLKLFKKDLNALEKAIKQEDTDFLLRLFTETRKIRKDIIK